MKDHDPQRSALELAHDAVQAVAEWAGDDFGYVDAETYARRLAACEACPFYTPPPARALYRVARWTSPDARICSRCGCFMKLKARLPKQRCPSEAPDHPGLTRWGEPLVR